MRKLVSIFLVTVLVAMTGGQVLADICTSCGCGMDESQCNEWMPSCGGAKRWRQQHREISVLGKADGRTTDNKSFGWTDTASGTVSLNVMGRTDIRRIDATWGATYQGTAADESDFFPSKRQIWDFTVHPNPAGNRPGDVVGTGKATITGDENGATGTVTGWKVVTNTGTLLNVKFQVQFVGNKLQFTGFYEDLSKPK